MSRVAVACERAHRQTRAVPLLAVPHCTLSVCRDNNSNGHRKSFLPGDFWWSSCNFRFPAETSTLIVESLAYPLLFSFLSFSFPSLLFIASTRRVAVSKISQNVPLTLFQLEALRSLTEFRFAFLHSLFVSLFRIASSHRPKN